MKRLYVTENLCTMTGIIRTYIATTTNGVSTLQNDALDMRSTCTNVLVFKISKTQENIRYTDILPRDTITLLAITSS